ncbi:protein PLASTID MOVEMENT IMPAIRED 15 [Ziziphus jujuba]|uniref:Protein PLASTID MOVEMENT IMPAIRED 15 n=2 Tax=Ziziphus jujuba TaxID=326968 RepID=A0ABM4A6T1_ZIZJJ|nr:protein PLASTID MOVEMENT IMPAIRED 15 [Ziziphus jujuba]KAH7533931.1 hypothetical protein FEM48_Zijuj04G0183900 [Ziziphus jujuba var. spinosa]
MMKDLSPLPRKSNSKEKVEGIQTPKKSRSEEKILTVEDMKNDQYAEVKRELEIVKEELNMLKLGMAAALEEKSKGEKQTKTKISSYSSSLQPVKKDTGKESEEKALVEFAKSETQLENEADQISSKIEQAKKKLKDIIVDLQQTRELEFDMRSDSLDHRTGSFRKQEDLQAELEAAKKELALVKEENFQYLTSMDIIRNELKHVMAELSRLKKIEEKLDSIIEDLNSKILKSKTKLEAVSLAVEKAKSIESNLSYTLEQLKTEAENAKKEKELPVKESVNLEAEIHNTKFEIGLIEERLLNATKEFEAVKSSEDLAVENLRSLIENIMTARALVPQQGSLITISKFEYEYLTGRAVGAEEIADKKVAASQAWIEAIKANEKDILIKIDLAQREIRGKKLEEEREAHTTKRANSGKRMVEGAQLYNRKQNWERNARLHRKIMKGNDNSTPSRKDNHNFTPSRKGNDNLAPSRRGNGNNSTPSNKLILAYES